ncbi:PP2C family protein-serine/threonine phosphatase [Streptomyces zhihengii]
MTAPEESPVQQQGMPTVTVSWLRAPYPSFVVDADGGVVEVNEAATRLFPGMITGAWLADVAPSWLADAHSRFTAAARRRTDPPGGHPAEPGPAGVFPVQAARGPHGGRMFAAHPTPSAGGDVAWWLADDTDRHAAEEALRGERERALLLTEASSQLLASLNVDRCMEVTAQLAAEHLADAAIVVAPRIGRRHAVIAASGGRTSRHTTTMDPTLVPGLAEALQGFPPVPSRWIDPLALPGWVVPDGWDGPVGSVVVTPLPGHGVPAGALILLRRDGHAAFTASDELFGRLFAARAGAAVSAARMYSEQATITRTLMAELLPPRLHHVNGVDFAGGYRAARDSDRIGGDFYDVHPGATPDSPSLVVLGDVCGKGLEAAVLTGRIRTTLQAMIPLSGDHQQMLRLLNGSLVTSRHTRFATLVLASVRREGGRTGLRLTSAGHPPPLIVRNTGEVEEADTAGTLVGALPEVTARSTAVDLAPGETCVLYTDGITEARGGPLGGDMFGETRLKAALGECAGLPAEAVVERVQMLASQWVGDRAHDDMAVVAITAPHSTHLTAVDGRTRGRFTA